MELVLQREPSAHGATYGKLEVDGRFECETLEDVVREQIGVPVEQWKVAGQTAIPAGRYAVTIDVSYRFKRLMPHILDVPGFEGIRLHSGNIAQQTDGCPMVGRGRQDFGATLQVGEHTPIPGVTMSHLAFDNLFVLLRVAFNNGEAICITVKNPECQPGL